MKLRKCLRRRRYRAQFGLSKRWCLWV